MVEALHCMQNTLEGFDPWHQIYTSVNHSHGNNNYGLLGVKMGVRTATVLRIGARN